MRRGMRSGPRSSLKDRDRAQRQSAASRFMSGIYRSNAFGQWIFMQDPDLDELQEEHYAEITGVNEPVEEEEED